MLPASLRLKLRAHRRAGGRDFARLQPRSGFGKSDKRLVHKARQKTVGAAGNGVRFMQKGFRAEILSDPEPAARW